MGPGDRIRDRYRLERWIASGGMGSVWEAYDLALDQSVALKRVSFAGLSPREADESRARTLREARTAARLRLVPEVIATLDVIEDEGDVWLVQEYLPSRSLSDVLAGNRRLPLDEVARIGATVARALDAAVRAGVVHRDVKPGNVLIAEADGTVKLTDFGISHAEGESRLTRTDAVSGTPAFMSREVAIGEQATHASDVFSLGSTLYRAAEGIAPFGEDDNLHRLLYRVGGGRYRMPEASGPLTPLLLAMLDHEPGRRPTAAQVAGSLDDLAARLRAENEPTLTGLRTPAALRTATAPGPTGDVRSWPTPGVPPAAPSGTWFPARTPAGPPDRTPDPAPDRPGQPGRRAVLVGGAATVALVATAVVVGPGLVRRGNGGSGTTSLVPPGGAAVTTVPADAVAVTASVDRNPLPEGTPGTGRPTVVLGSKNFAEQVLLGELYTQALQAKGYTIAYKPSVGGSEVIDRTLQSGQTQMYPEYLGETVTSVAKLPAPTSASDTYEQAKRWLETNRASTILLQTPFQDTDAIVVAPATAREYGLATVADLGRIGPGGRGVTVAGPTEFQVRQTGLVGMKQAYGLPEVGYLATPAGDQYQAVDRATARAANAFTTDQQLLSGRYTVLADPRLVFTPQYVAPIVKQDVLAAQGPEFAATANWVSSLLTVEAIQSMNAQVQSSGQPAASVAQRFLLTSGLR